MYAKKKRLFWCVHCNLGDSAQGRSGFRHFLCRPSLVEEMGAGSRLCKPWSTWLRCTGDSCACLSWVLAETALRKSKPSMCVAESWWYYYFWSDPWISVTLRGVRNVVVKVYKVEKYKPQLLVTVYEYSSTINHYNKFRSRNTHIRSQYDSITKLQWNVIILLLWMSIG